MKPGEIHVYVPEVTDKSFRVLGKRCRNFDGGPFLDIQSAMDHGMKTYRDGFRIFRQSCSEWHAPLNIEIIKVGPWKDLVL